MGAIVLGKKGGFGWEGKGDKGWCGIPSGPETKTGLSVGSRA